MEAYTSLQRTLEVYQQRVSAVSKRYQTLREQMAAQVHDKAHECEAELNSILAQLRGQGALTDATSSEVESQRELQALQARLTAGSARALQLGKACALFQVCAVARV